MKPEIVLCTDSESVKNPELIGLGGENLLAQPWLRLFCSALEARNYLREAESVKEVWVASNDEVEPINLAAAIKKDMCDRGVYLLAFDGGGSLKSRASAAGIDATLTRSDFASRYAQKKSAAAEGERVDEVCASACSGLAASPGKAKPTRELPTIDPFDMSGQAVVEHSREGIAEMQRSVPAPASTVRCEFQTGTRSLQSQKAAALFTVVSASGGAGKSTIAVLSAFFSQGFGRKTLLLDADMQFGDMRYLAGVEKPITLDEVVADRAKLDKLVSNDKRPALLAAPKRLEQSEVIAEGLLRIIDEASSRFDVVVVNTSSHWDEMLAQLLERSSHVLFLVDQRAASLRASKHALEMCARCGIATTPFVFAVNRCSKNALLSSFDVACSLGGSRAVELKEGGKEVDELLGAGLPLDLIDSRNDLCLSLERALLDILPNDAEGSASGALGPSARSKRFSFGRRRGRAACL